ncbi:hypothetical protein LZ32DRAFT_459852 [Colletotrichum eremochloae]|nr:hypothetical protein LZ32DRAFT_459852 [Colletotrichum eremochloae]
MSKIARQSTRQRRRSTPLLILRLLRREVDGRLGESALSHRTRVKRYLGPNASEWFSPLMKAQRYTIPLAPWVETDAVSSAIRARTAAEPDRSRQKCRIAYSAQSTRRGRRAGSWTAEKSPRGRRIYPRRQRYAKVRALCALCDSPTTRGPALYG